MQCTIVYVKPGCLAFLSSQTFLFCKEPANASPSAVLKHNKLLSTGASQLCYRTPNYFLLANWILVPVIQLLCCCPLLPLGTTVLKVSHLLRQKNNGPQRCPCPDSWEPNATLCGKGDFVRYVEVRRPQDCRNSSQGALEGGRGEDGEEKLM